MNKVIISGTGLYHPPDRITNEELVNTYNTYVQFFNQQHSEQINRGEIEPLRESSCEFILKASGIQQRYVVEKSGILNPQLMHPLINEKENAFELSLQAQMAIYAAQDALKNSRKQSHDLDTVIVACSNLQRPYPAIAIEVQHALGIEGYAFDMNVACSSATFALQMGFNLIATGQSKGVLIINPEICSAGLNYRDRDSHFIFGDAATAVILESANTNSATNSYEILSIRLKTSFSNNIRSNFGYLNTMSTEVKPRKDTLFMQNGRHVFREVVPMATHFIQDHIFRENLQVNHIKRFWLHQANLNMNQLIIEKLLGRKALPEEAPIILNEYANTASAGSIIAFHLHQAGFQSGDFGLISSFGAGYSIGSVLVRKQ